MKKPIQKYYSVYRKNSIISSIEEWIEEHNLSKSVYIEMSPPPHERPIPSEETIIIRVDFTEKAYTLWCLTVSPFIQSAALDMSFLYSLINEHDKK
jgi:hypothetical protein